MREIFDQQEAVSEESHETTADKGDHCDLAGECWNEQTLMDDEPGCRSVLHRGVGQSQRFRPGGSLRNALMIGSFVQNPGLIAFSVKVSDTGQG